MKIVFFTFYYSPDLCAGSFRAIALAKALEKKLGDNDQLHVITTHPNRYAAHRVEAEDLEVNGKITIHRIAVPSHKSGMISQMRTFGVYAFYAFRLCWKLKPNFLIGTTSRLMTGVLTWLSARSLRRTYYIDLRDIFSETISDLLARKNKILGTVMKHVFSFLERRVFNNAAGVNVVSKGFPEYFETNGIDTTKWSFYPNGVDQEFMSFPSVNKNTSKQSVKTILYAGNIGNGQGLETIIPAVAKRLGDSYRFVIVGDGGTSSLLRNAIKKDRVSNVEMYPPVGREKLIEYYRNADILFLHLNDVPAFRRVLPSKIFEYAALGKPIVAGLNGYSASFLKEHIPCACIFKSTDYIAAVNCIKTVGNLDEKKLLNSDFISRFSRVAIMNEMADDVLSIVYDR